MSGGDSIISTPIRLNIHATEPDAPRLHTRALGDSRRLLLPCRRAHLPPCLEKMERICGAVRLRLSVRACRCPTKARHSQASSQGRRGGRALGARGLGVGGCAGMECLDHHCRASNAWRPLMNVRVCSCRNVGTSALVDHLLVHFVVLVRALVDSVLNVALGHLHRTFLDTVGSDENSHVDGAGSSYCQG